MSRVYKTFRPPFDLSLFTDNVSTRTLGGMRAQSRYVAWQASAFVCPCHVGEASSRSSLHLITFPHPRRLHRDRDYHVTRHTCQSTICGPLHFTSLPIPTVTFPLDIYNSDPDPLYFQSPSGVGFFSSIRTTMKASLLPRTASIPIQHYCFATGSPKVSLSVHDSTSKSGGPAARIALHAENTRVADSTRGIRRASSESDIIRSESKVAGVGSRSFSSIILEEEYVSEADEGFGRVQSLILEGEGLDRNNYIGNWPESGIPAGGGGGGDGWSGGSFNDGSSDRNQIPTYYEEMLKSDPTNSLLLRNYGTFLYEVEGDSVKAEECYGRAILASPDDGEVLSLYGKLIWETQGDKERAQSYYDRAITASPDDCTVLGSYARFLWEAEDEEEDDGGIQRENEPWAAISGALS
ncbi:uncharacterized protein LOC127812556 [Diospyros lotus]|uniref:uncharacterized protein LOC127812556 n=1 Tax=Diospyros lotus TaxID=55363 RepID=UPI00224E64DB|nr:uncharacterized protein LOC127812556 [Diospyros lotus]